MVPKEKDSDSDVSDIIEDTKQSIRDAAEGRVHEDEESLRERISELRGN